MAYVTKCWLRLVVPTDDPNRGRWPEHPTWVALCEAFSKLAICGARELSEAERELVRTARYSGFRRLLDRMAVELLTTEQALDMDLGTVLVTSITNMTRVARHIRRQQKLRVKWWELH